jgi:hypothetical protein
MAGRLPDWPERLMALLDAEAARPFAWGESDCVVGLAARGVEAVTGTDPCADLRGRYKTARGAAGLLRRLGGLEAAVAARLGPPLASPALAHRGDVAMLEERGMPVLGLCVGNGRLAVKAPDGLAHRPMSRAVRAWPVGR